MSYTKQELITVVARSPVACATHDREGWLGLFSADADIQDPIGSPSAPKANGVLGRFWDTFIGPNQVDMEILRDHISGRDVFRDVIIHTVVGGKVRVDVPAYLLYQLDDTSGKLEVARMRAHWNLAVLSLGALKLGPKAWVAMTVLFGRMLRLMGLPWVAGYLATLWTGIGRRGLQTVERLQGAIEARDEVALAELLEPDAVLELGIVEAPARDLLTLLPAGSRLRVEAPVAAAWTTSFRFTVDGPAPRSGLGLFEFAPTTRRLRKLRFFSA